MASIFQDAETVEEYASTKGTKYYIENDEQSLWHIRSEGGGYKPSILFEKFTSRVKAAAALEEYLKSTEFGKYTATIPPKRGVKAVKED